MKVAKKHNSNLFGFTIVELLVVIVVIGILVAITIVAYTGISQRAIVASIQSDLSGASKQLNMFQVTNSAYPNSVTDCPTPVSTDICLKLSPGNTVSSYSANNSANPQTYSLAIANGSNIYEVSNGTQPSQLASAPLSPVADWLATTQGDHYGNYYDLVGHNWATVSRSGSGKTIYDPTTNHIYDVPANYLGVNPRSDGKSGSEAVVEESRTNYLTNSYGAANDGSKWTTNWSYSQSVTGTPTYSLVQGLYSTTAQRIQYSGNASDTGKAIEPLQKSALGSFSAGDNATFSYWVKGSLVNSSIRLYMYALDSSGNTLGGVSPAATVSSNFNQVTVTYSNLPTNTSCVEVFVFIGVANNSIIDVTFDAVQLEKGAFATSYIPTTTTAVTRNADVVTVPTSSWSSSAGSIFVVAGQPGNKTTTRLTQDWYGAGGRINTYQSGGNFYGSFQWTGNNANSHYATPGSGYYVGASTFAIGDNVTGYVNGSGGTPTGTPGTPSGLQSLAYIGQGAGITYLYSGPIQRLTVYNSALSSSDVTTVTNAVQNGP